jgi:hypothetical protein
MHQCGGIKPKRKKYTYKVSVSETWSEGIRLFLDIHLILYTLCNLHETPWMRLKIEFFISINSLHQICYELSCLYKGIEVNISTYSTYVLSKTLRERLLDSFLQSNTEGMAVAFSLLLTGVHW